ncbi:MAG TPA: FeoA family protein [Spirochaetia bacterium]|nr:FeoA family protein [Spirochaetia bacterium]
MMPLSNVKTGSKVRIVGCKAGKNLERRLEVLGCIPGEIIRVSLNDGHSPLIINVKGADVMLGRGMCGKIFVELPETDEKDRAAV